MRLKADYTTHRAGQMKVAPVQLQFSGNVHPVELCWQRLLPGTGLHLEFILRRTVGRILQFESQIFRGHRGEESQAEEEVGGGEIHD